jgi:cytochrome c oxidase subunit 1
VGAFIIAVGGIVFILNVVNSLKHGDVAGANPWDSGTLEWAADSPPPHYNFVNLPAATSRYPLWSDPKERIVVTGLRDDRREVLVTTLMDAEPHHRLILPGPSIWPFLTATLTGIGLIGSVFQFSWYYLACLLAFVGLLGWFWPRKPAEAEQ